MIDLERIHPRVWVGRVFPEGSPYGCQFKAVFTLKRPLFSRRIVWLYGLHGEMVREDFNELKRQLRDRGFRELKGNRLKGKQRVWTIKL